MNLTDEQLERIGRFLDGEALDLTDAERAVAEQVRRDEADLGGLLDVALPEQTGPRALQLALTAEVRRDEALLGPLLDAPVPPGTMQRVHRRVLAELARPQRRLLRIGSAAAAVAAAAAILLVVALLPRQPAREAPIRAALPQAPVPVDVIVASVQEPRDLAVDLLAEEIDQLEAEILASGPPAPVDLGIDQLQGALEGFWLDGPLH